MHTASYNLHDDRLKLFLDQSERIPREEFNAFRQTGMAWWRGSKCLTGVWSPSREDLVLKYAEGGIETIIDDDAGFTYRLERYERYAEHAEERAEAEEKRLAGLTEMLPPGGQPIPPSKAGHARRVQKMLDGSMRRHAWELDKADYWADRQKVAERIAAYKELPPVIAQRIEGLEAELRKYQREADRTNWRPYREQTGGDTEEAWQLHLAWANRWIEHLEMVLDYQRELYRRSGGTAVDRGDAVLEVGGAIKCAWGFNGLTFHPIVSVNPKSVTIPDTYNWDGSTVPDHVFTRTVKKVDIKESLSIATYKAHPEYEKGQRLLAGLKPKEAKVALEKGGALKFRYWGGAVQDSEWCPVARINTKTITVLRWSNFGGRAHWYEHKVDKELVTASMSAVELAEYIGGHPEEEQQWTAYLKSN